MKKRTAISIIVVLMMVVTMMASCTTSSTPSVAASTAPTQAVQSQAPATSEATTGNTAVGQRYDLNKDTCYDIVIGGGSWTDWWVNAPQINQFKKDPPYKVGFITSWRGEPWQETCIAEFQREVDRSKVAGLITDYVHMDSAANVDTEIANLEAMFTMWQNDTLDAIIVDPLDPVALNATISKIYKAGCPIILFNDTIKSTEYTSCISDDPIQYGANDAEWLAKKLNYEGNILFFRGLQGYPIDDGRAKGAIDVFAKYPGIKIIDTEYGQWSQDVAKQKFMDAVAAHPDFDGIYSEGGQMSLAIINAMIELGMDPSKYAHASEDNNGFLKMCIQYNIPACASCHPSIMSAIAVNVTEMLLQGYPVPKLYYFPAPFIADTDFSKYVRPNAPDGIFVSTPLPDETLNSIIK